MAPERIFKDGRFTVVETTHVDGNSQDFGEHVLEKSDLKRVAFLVRKQRQSISLEEQGDAVQRLTHTCSKARRHVVMPGSFRLFCWRRAINLFMTPKILFTCILSTSQFHGRHTPRPLQQGGCLRVTCPGNGKFNERLLQIYVGVNQLFGWD